MTDRSLTEQFFEIHDRLVKDHDPEVAAALENERLRQNDGLELIASENFVSPAVLAAMGSVMTNKYAEGYPGKRYYGGCQFVDVAEDLARERVKALFGAEHANVQPHSGAQANMGVYLAVMQPGDTLLGMDLTHGGHLTHGHPLNYSGKEFEVVAYGVDKTTETIDYDRLRELALEHHPKLIVCGASAYPRIIDFARLRAIADEADALLMADIAHIAGLVVAGLHPSPVPHCHFVTSTTHKTLRGPRGGIILCGAEWAEAIDKAVFPGVQGGPLMHVIAAKAVAFAEAMQPEWKDYQKRVVDQLGGALQRGRRARLADRLRRHRQPPLPGRPRRRLHLGQEGRTLAGPRRHHRQQEHRALRHPQALHRLGSAHRHPGRDHPRHGARRDGADRRADRPRAPGRRRHRGRGQDGGVLGRDGSGRIRGPRPDREFPLY